ncbi:Myosin-1 [Toxocara canis]|uniref:Paramyosin n=1 Tax=Toxocara canis TaxID=6265 RepID=A0A0B2UR03_TOXCA|nr:Myosin-1 [Toxocara canis]
MVQVIGSLMIAKKAELDEAYTELKSSEELSKNAALEAARLAQQLQLEQERSQFSERERKGLELCIKELQAKIDDAESALLKGAEKEMRKMEHRMKALNTEVESEKRRNQEAIKTITKQERKARELQFQIDENGKKYIQLQNLVDKLQLKLKLQKKQADEAVGRFARVVSTNKKLLMALYYGSECYMKNGKPRNSFFIFSLTILKISIEIH